MEASESHEASSKEKTNENIVPDDYGDDQDPSARWSDSFNRLRPSHTSSGDNQEVQPCDFVSLISVISQVYLYGNYVAMRCLDRERWDDLDEGGTFQVSSSEISFEATAPGHLEPRRIYNKIIIKQTKARNNASLAADAIKAVKTELIVLHRLQGHPNIVDLRGIGWLYDFEDRIPSPKPVLMLEPASCTLGHLLRVNDDLDPLSQAKIDIFCGITSGLRALHDSNIVHGDVKPANILLFKKERRDGGKILTVYVAKVSDFSLSLLPKDTTYPCRLPGGTSGWRAPEARKILTLEGLKKTDLWSLGLLFVAVSAGSDNIVQDKRETFERSFAVQANAQYHFESSIEQSTLEEPEIELARALYRFTVQVDPGHRDLGRLLIAFEKYKGEALSRRDITRTLRFQAVCDGPSDLCINYEALRPLSGVLKDLIFELLQQVSKTSKDARQSSALYELAVMTFSKWVVPDAKPCKGLEFLMKATLAGHVRAKGYYYRLEQLWKKQPLTPHVDNDEQKLQWLHEAAVAGHQLALFVLNGLDGEEARVVQRARGAMYKLENGNQVVHSAAATEDWELLNGGNGKSPLRHDSEGNTPLLVAAQFGHFAMSKYLLEEGADASITNDLGENALHHICHFSTEEAQELLPLLVARGADATAVAKGRLHENHLDVFPILSGLPVERAVGFGRLDVVDLMLQQSPLSLRHNNVVRRMFLWAVRLHHVKIQKHLIQYFADQLKHAEGEAKPLIRTLWTHNLVEKTLLEAACIGWISAEMKGLPLPFNYWMQLHHGSNWIEALESTLKILCYLEKDEESREKHIDRALRTAFQTSNCEAFSVLMDLKIEITARSHSRAAPLRQLVWQDYEREPTDPRTFTFWSHHWEAFLRYRGKRLNVVTDERRRDQNWNPLQTTERRTTIRFVDQIFHDSEKRTLAQQAISSGNRGMLRLLVSNFGADVQLPVSHNNENIPGSFKIRELARRVPETLAQFNCYCLIACSIHKDVWFADQLHSRGLKFHHPFLEPPITKKFYIPPLFYAVIFRFWPFCLWLLEHNRHLLSEHMTGYTTVLEQLLSLGVVRKDILEFFFRGSHGGGKGSKFVPASLNNHGGYPLFRLFFDCITGANSRWPNQRCYTPVNIYRDVDNGYSCDTTLHLGLLRSFGQTNPSRQRFSTLHDSDDEHDEEIFRWRLAYVKCCEEIQRCWDYLLRTYPTANNEPTLRGNLHVHSLLDMSVRLFSHHHSRSLYEVLIGKDELVVFGDAEGMTESYGSIQPAASVRWPEYASYLTLESEDITVTAQFSANEVNEEFFRFRQPAARGLLTLSSTIRHFEDEQRLRGRRFPTQRWQSRLFGSPLDLLCWKCDTASRLRSLGWRPSLFHPTYRAGLCFFFTLTLFAYMCVDATRSHFVHDMWRLYPLSTILRGFRDACALLFFISITEDLYYRAKMGWTLHRKFRRTRTISKVSQLRWMPTRMFLGLYLFFPLLKLLAKSFTKSSTILDR